MEGTLVGVDPETEVRGVAYDSRRVCPGDLFFALSGLRRNGGSFVRDSLAAGAVAAVLGPEASLEGVPQVRVEEPRRALALASARLHGHPSRVLKVVGITGTNGKTTTTWLMAAIFRAAGTAAGLIGTTGYRFGTELRPAPFTTPEAPELQRLLRDMVDAGIGAVAIELSSHALAQRRCFDLDCDVAVFTNLSHDHLDYHGTLERYLDAKLMLFDGRNRRAPGRAHAVINRDDARAAAVLEAARRGGLEIRTYGAGGGADVTIRALEPFPGGLRFELVEGGRPERIELPLLGRYNAWNAAAAFAAARALGIPAATAAAGLATVEPVPGRLERVDEGQGFAVIVDYAHTPDALTQAIAAVREHVAGRVLVVFGCGGDRDRAKRPLMGRVASERGDRGWITSDNPRSEDPAVIAAEIAAGDPAGRLAIELDRRRAIAAALAAAAPGDAVLVAGKGHEATQTIGDRVLPFDDREAARALLRESGARR